jgi:hypothetical protein
MVKKEKKAKNILKIFNEELEKFVVKKTSELNVLNQSLMDIMINLSGPKMFGKGR